METPENNEYLSQGKIAEIIEDYNNLSNDPHVMAKESPEAIERRREIVIAYNKIRKEGNN